MSIGTQHIIDWDSELLARAESLEWRSRVLVQGFMQGVHRSRLLGFSSEFAQYHAYMPGDDLRYLDWKAYGRSDRLYIREFEAETNLRCQLVIDASASMAYRSETARFTKFEYASLLAAALMRLMQKQHDAFGLGIARSELSEYVPPRVGNSHFVRCLGFLEKAEPAGTLDFDLTLHTLAELLPKRNLVVIFTDAWDALEPLAAGLRRLAFDHHEICLMQVVDPQEIDFAFEASRVFEDPETQFRLPITPAWNRSRYLGAIQAHLGELKNLCCDMGVSYTMMRTTDSPYLALIEFLLQRGRRR